MINRFIGGRSLNVAVTFLIVLAGVVYVVFADETIFVNDTGLCLPSCNLWLGSGWMSFFLNVCCIVAVGYMLKHLNRLHGFIRADASVALSAFMLLEMASPSVVACFYEGTMMLLVVLLSAYLLFDTYHRRLSQRSIFLVFFLLSLYSMFQCSALYLVAVAVLGFIQMQVMRFRGMIATLLGLVTPYWIFYGFGIISFDDFRLPEIYNSWFVLHSVDSWVVVATCGLTALVALILMATSMVKIISYNAKRRACNGFFSVLTIATVIMSGVDYANIFTYLPTLNLCLAIQVGHAFTISSNERRYIPVLVLCAVCLGLYVYNFYNIL